MRIARSSFRPSTCLTAALASCAIAVPLVCRAAPPLPRLPLPTRSVPDEPRFPASVVTAAGQRLLLTRTDVSVTYDAATKQLTANRPGWWVINYPLGRMKGMEGKTEDEIAQVLFGCSAKGVTNWYVKTVGDAAVEPTAPSGPAPIELTPNPAFVVDAVHPDASDTNSGTVERPFKTIAAAVANATAGQTVRVLPGLYREKIDVDTGGTAETPVRIEGVQDATGQMPIVSGNDLFPPNSWAPVANLPGVYRAPIFTGVPGVVSVDGQTLKEVSWPEQLKPGEFCLNRASRQFLVPRSSQAVPRVGVEESGKTWRRIEADGDGSLHLGPGAKNAILFLSSWVWVPPKKRKDNIVWDPTCPEPITGKLSCGGPFRAFRQTGTGMHVQMNKYRLWVNGTLCPSAWEPGKPRPHHNYGKTDRWESFALNEGWNHLLFQFDTTTKPSDDPTFRFGVPKGVKGYMCSSEPPADRTLAPAGTTVDHLSEALLLGPFPADPDVAVYVRLPDGRDPNSVPMDLAKRTSLAVLDVPFVQMRGLEFRHGACFQQRAQLTVSAEGCLVEGCLFRDSEVRGITVALKEMDQTDAPIVVRNNWVLNPGGVGISASGSTDKLTAENQDTTAPGRGRLICEYNRVDNNNCHGYARFWESGGFKMFKLTGCVLRNNTFVGGDGPSLWLDWEHYGNRVEGNLSIDGTAFCIGIEASAGPNLVANNIVVNLKTGGAWFRHGILSWSSHAVWAMYNTIDGRWNPEPAWNGKTGGGGIYLHEGNPDRHTRWGAVPKQQAIINNLIAGVDSGDVIRRWGWNPDTPEIGNHHDTRESSWNGTNGPTVFQTPETYDYRLTGAATVPGEKHPLADLVRHDFYGLLRHPDQPRVSGACRVDPPAPPDARTLIEVEMADGTMKRLY